MDRASANSIVSAAWNGKRVDNGKLSAALDVAGIPPSRFCLLKEEARKVETRFPTGTVLTPSGHGKRTRTRTC